MIGQNRIKGIIEHLLNDETLPQYINLVGNRGSGRYEVAKWIAERTESNLYLIENNKADTIKDAIEHMHKAGKLTTYIMLDADDMSSSAMNALLKVCEETPYNVRIIMTFRDSYNVPLTMQSRALSLVMDVYSKEELAEYLNLELPTVNKSDALKICDTIGELESIKDYDTTAFLKYVKTVVDNIATVSGANAFKIGDKIALSANSEKYALDIFLKAFIKECEARVFDKIDDEFERTMYAKAMMIASKALVQLNVKGANKQQVLDMFILDIRKAWM